MPSRRNARSSKSSRHQSTVATPIDPQTPALETPAELPLLDFGALEGHINAQPTSGPSPVLSSGSLPSSPPFFEPPLIPTGGGQRSPPALSFEEFSNSSAGGRYDVLGQASTLWESYAAPQDLVEPNIPELSSPAHGPSNGLLDSMLDAYGTPGDVVPPTLPAEVDVLPPSAEMEERTFEPVSPPRILVPPSPSPSPVQVPVFLPVPESSPPVSPVPLPVPPPRRFASGYGDAGNGGVKDAAPSGHAYSNLTDGSPAGSGLAQAMKRSSASSSARARKNGARKASSPVGGPITKASPGPVAELPPEPIEATSAPPAVISRRRDPSISLSPAVSHNVTTALPTEPANPLTAFASEVPEGPSRSVKTTTHTATPVSSLVTSSKSSSPSNTSVSPVKTISPRNKRFSAPLPFTQLSAGAPAVVDLGVAGAGGGGGYGGGYTDGASYGTRGASERGGPRIRAGNREGDGEIMWAHWDHVFMSPGPEEEERRLLFVGYAYALQVWDCSTLDAVDEVLSVRVGGEAVGSQDVEPDEWEGAGRLVHAGVLRGPGGAMIGVLTEGTGGGQGAGGVLFVYSLQLCRVVRRIELAELGKGSKKAWEGVPVTFEANEKFIIISAVSPPSLTVLSTETFAFLTHIRSEALVAYAPPTTGYPGSQGPASGFATSASAAASAVLPTTAMGAATTAYGAATTATAMLSNAFAGSYNNRFNPTHTNPGRNLYNNNYIYDNADTHFNTYHQRNNNNNNPVALHSALLLDSRAGGGQEQRQQQQSQYQHLHQSSQHQGQLQHQQAPQYQEHPRPVFSLSNRLLAYASPVPPGSRTSSPTSTVPPVGVAAGTSVSPGNRSSTGGSSVTGGLGLPTTQAELGNAALRVGGSVLSGMRTLGGLAVSAARSRVSGGDPNPGGGVGGLTNRFFSRSAPADVDAGVREEEERRKRERRYSGTTNSSMSGSPGDGDVGGSGSVMGKYLQRLGPTGGLEGGCYVTVVDLATLSAGAGGEPTKVAEFMVSKDRPIAGLTFSPDGCSIMVAPRDGQVLQVYQVRPVPVVGCGIGSASGDGEGRTKRTSISGAAPGGVRREARTPWHVYDLRRGRTSAVVEGMDWAEDGRWIAIGTRKRTVHVFAVNPYGGKPDHRSHLDGRVRNVPELQPVPTDLGPIIRLRVAKALGPEQPRAPLAFTFIKSNESTLPSNLLPSVTAAPSISTASADSGTSPPTSPRPLRRRPTNFQDILLFDPTDGTLSLRRCTVELRPKEQGLASAALTATSISLPGMGGAGRLSGSPSSSAGGYGHARSSSRSRTGLTPMTEVPTELTGRDNIVATWALQRRRDSREIRKPLEERGGDADYGPERSERGDWLAQAELSTCSRSHKILPRPIYLSHQFSFHTLGEDYHALIRRYQFDIGGQKMEVRKEVQVSAYPAGSGESFVEGFSAPRDMRNRTLSSSFDEPLASALTGDLDYPHTSNVLPMLPNGTPRSKPQSFRSSIPIRTMTDGMSESLGRFRREIIKARSPRLRPRPDSSMSASVPLEFDEEDEDFLSNDTLDVPALDRDADSGSRGTSRGGADSGASISTPATSTRPLEDEVEDAWNGWTSEDKLAVEEAERFDNISVVGFLDEEQTAAAVVPIAAPKKKGRGRRR